VEALGEGARGVNVGDAVMGIVGGGAQADYVTVAASHCAPVPAALDVVAMGGVPEAFITAHDAMVTQGALQPGEWMLIHAVGSGVGTTALQLGRELDAHVVGTARTPDKIERCRALGLEVGLVPVTAADGSLDVDALAWSIVEATGNGADVTLDLAGGPYVAVNISSVAGRAPWPDDLHRNGCRRRGDDPGCRHPRQALAHHGYRAAAAHRRGESGCDSRVRARRGAAPRGRPRRPDCRGGASTRPGRGG